MKLIHYSIPFKWTHVLAVLFCLGTVMTHARAETGIILADPGENLLFSQNPDNRLVPASILKILTSLAAIQHLGLDFRYQTGWHYDPATRNLYIKGYGDPLFISETIRDFAGIIAKTIHPHDIHDIILDHSFFDPDIRIPGAGRSLNPYDATSGALCANFNTILFQRDPASGQFKSAEPQTPLLSFFIPALTRSGLNHGRITLPKDQSLLYPGLLIQHFLEKNAVSVTGSVYSKTGPGTYSHTFSSPHTLEDLIRRLLTYSNNFMANQLMLTLGARLSGPPATLEKGVAALKQFAGTRLDLTDLVLSEGSGISRETRISPLEMIRILEHFKPFYFLLTQEDNEFFKTGTLSGIRTRAGYIQGKNNALYPFVIMVNEPGRGYQDIRTRLIKTVRQAEQE